MIASIIRTWKFLSSRQNKASRHDGSKKYFANFEVYTQR